MLPGATEGWRLGRDCVPQREISSQLPARACVTGAEAGSVRAGAQLANLSRQSGEQVSWRLSPCSESLAGKQLLDLMAHEVLPGALHTAPAEPAGALTIFYQCLLISEYQQWPNELSK